MSALVPIVPVGGEFELDAGVVTISVVVGELQQGFTIVMLDDVELVSGAKVRDHPIGGVAELRDKTLWVDTTVTVTNPQTTRTSIQLILQDGSKTRLYPGARELSAIGDSVIYEGRITLT